MDDNFLKTHRNIKKILLDTSFILLAYQLKIDFLTELRDKLGDIEIYIIDKVVEEIKKISLENSYRGTFAKIALKYINRLIQEGKIIYISKKGDKRVTDDILLDEANENNASIATADMWLRRRAKKRNIGIIYIRASKKRIEFD